MPGIFSLTCTRCDFARSGSSSTWVLLSDGSERCCPHPSEIRAAEGFTGERWSDLTRAGRIRYKNSLVCLQCGECGDYGPIHPRAHTHIGNIVRQPGEREAKEHACRACGQHALFPIHGNSSSLGCLPLALPLALGLGAIAFGSQACWNGVTGMSAGHALIASAALGVASVACGWGGVRLVEREKQQGPSCPRCHEGKLRSELVAIS